MVIEEKNILERQAKTQKVYSFDIFDTLVSRRVATPLGIFAIMQEKLKTESKYSTLSQFFKSNFPEIRNKLEFWNRDNMFWNQTGHQDITFDEIYNHIQKNYNLTDKEINLLKELEIETEKNNLIPIDKYIKKVKKLILEDKKVILISDMYFSSSTIRYFLTNIDKVFKDIEIFVSSELFVTKNSGDMYKYIKNKKGYDFSKWEHYDDNNYNIDKAKHLGLNGISVPLITPPTLLKQIIQNKPFDLFYQAYIGTSKNVCLNTNNSEKYRFGAFFSGPILYSYVNWILEQADKLDIKHLYFVSRDGYIPMLIAEKILKKLNSSIEIHYLHGSRLAWRIPTKNNINDFIKTIFKEFRSELSLEFIAKRFNINVETLLPFVNIKSTKTILNTSQLWNLELALLNNDKFKNDLIAQNETKKELLIEYLKQEIDFSKNDFAFVEINGSGRTQDFLQSIINEFSTNNIVTFYYHLNIDANRAKLTNKHSYIPLQLFASVYLEMLCITTQGQTLGYIKNNDKISAISEKIDSKDILKWGYNDYIDGILDFTEKIIDFQIINNVNLNSINLYMEYFYFFTGGIDRETADILGSIPNYSVIGQEQTVNESIPAYTWKDIINMFLFDYQKNFLEHIAFARTSKKRKKLINYIKKNKKFGDLLISLLPFYKKDYNGTTYYFFNIFGIKIKKNISKPNLIQDIHFICTLIKFLLKKKPKEKIKKVERIKFITFREPLINGGGGGQGAALSMNKAILPHEFNGIPIDFIFEIPNKYSKYRNMGPMVEFSGIQFAIEQTQKDQNTLYLTHEEATAFGLWLMGKNYVMLSHIQGARAEESKNFGYKFSKISELIIKFCEGIAFKNAYSVSFPSKGAYEYYCKSPYRGANKNEFKVGPTIYNTLYAKNELEPYKDLKYDPEYITILSSGSLTVAKGVDRTLDLVDTILSKTTKKVRHIFVGEGILQYQVESKLAELSAKYPHFSYVTIGRCSDGQMPYLQSICDVFIVLHRIAIFDLATLEIMEKGKAVVLSNVGGNPEFNVENNIIMWDNNNDEIAETILNSDLKLLGENNKKIYNKYFGPEPYREIYHKFLTDFITKTSMR